MSGMRAKMTKALLISQTKGFHLAPWPWVPMAALRPRYAPNRMPNRTKRIQRSFSKRRSCAETALVVAAVAGDVVMEGLVYWTSGGNRGWVGWGMTFLGKASTARPNRGRRITERRIISYPARQVAAVTRISRGPSTAGIRFTGFSECATTTMMVWCRMYTGNIAVVRYLRAALSWF